jgi:hypothetical protein
MDHFLFDLDAEKSTIRSVPLRCPTPMPAQKIVPWTLAHLAVTLGKWLMTETILIPPPRQKKV